MFRLKKKRIELFLFRACERMCHFGWMIAKLESLKKNCFLSVFFHTFLSNDIFVSGMERLHWKKDKINLEIKIDLRASFIAFALAVVISCKFHSCKINFQEIRNEQQVFEFSSKNLEFRFLKTQFFFIKPSTFTNFNLILPKPDRQTCHITNWLKAFLENLPIHCEFGHFEARF